MTGRCAKRWRNAGNVDEFERAVTSRAKAIARDDGKLRSLLRDKYERRMADERLKPLAVYRAEELEKMRVNFYGDNPAYHEARRRFVYKGANPPKATNKLVSLSFVGYPVSRDGLAHH